MSEADGRYVTLVPGRGASWRVVLDGFAGDISSRESRGGYERVWCRVGEQMMRGTRVGGDVSSGRAATAVCGQVLEEVRNVEWRSCGSSRRGDELGKSERRSRSLATNKLPGGLISVHGRAGLRARSAVRDAVL